MLPLVMLPLVMLPLAMLPLAMLPLAMLPLVMLPLGMLSSFLDIFTNVDVLPFAGWSTHNTNQSYKALSGYYQKGARNQDSGE